MRYAPHRGLIFLICFCALLCGCSAARVVPMEPGPAASAMPSPTASAAPTPSPTLPPSPTPPPAPTPSPTPEPLPEGDFSYTFPQKDTGKGAVHSFQAEDVRIAVQEVKEGGVTYYVADIWVQNIDYFRTAFARGKYGGGRQNILTLMKNNDAILAISGDYYGARKEGVVIRNGEVYRDTPHVDVCVLYRSGEMKTYSSGAWSSIQNTEEGVYQAWGFGPMLLDGNAEPMTLAQFDGFEYEKLHPRAAIGYYEPGHYCFVVVDGRRKGHSVGMLLSELSTLFHRLGCKAAYNLDGGATAILAYEGKYVNKPYDDGRSQYDIIYIARPAATPKAKAVGANLP